MAMANVFGDTGAREVDHRDETNKDAGPVPT